MAVWSHLVTHWAVNLVDSQPRNAAVTGIQNHHTATNNKLNALALFAPGGREVTPNYFVAGREVWGIVPEDRRAYTSGSSYDDHRAITMEILNLTNNPDWQFAADTIATVIALNTDIAKRYGVPVRHALNGIYEHRNISAWTGRSYATACAGPSFSISHVIAMVGSGGSSKSRRKKSMATMYSLQNSKPTLFALAGDSPGTSANWLETTDSGFANQLAETHGNAKMLAPSTWESWKSRYLEPVKVSGGGGGGGASAAEVADELSKRLSA